MLLLVLLGLFLWVIGLYALEATNRRVETLRRRKHWQKGDAKMVLILAATFPFSAFYVVGDGVASGLRGPEKPDAKKSEDSKESRSENHTGELFEIALWVALAFWTFVIGFVLMAIKLPFWQVTGFVAGPACLGGAFWVLQHYRKMSTKWRLLRSSDKASDRAGGFNHGGDTLLHFAGIGILLLLGVLILSAAL